MYMFIYMLQKPDGGTANQTCWTETRGIVRESPPELRVHCLKQRYMQFNFPGQNHGFPGI